MDTTAARVIDMWAKPPLPKHNVPLAEAARRHDSASGSRSSGSQHGRSRERAPPRTTEETYTSTQSPGLLHKILFQGYLKTGEGGQEVPPLQIRRTLDHYFYSHLESMSRRDADQVIQRYTARFMNVEPKMFMVDQLWIWVLDNSKLQL